MSKPEPSKAVSEILDLINQECIYWHGRDESRRGGYAILLQKAKDISDKEVSRSEELSRLFVDATEQACKAMTERNELLGLLREAKADIQDWLQSFPDANEEPSYRIITSIDATLAKPGGES
ncbi:MAG: hypothetical protein JKY26_06490 [Pseudomonas sp.]|nr:hypothetical protein [Pseudomonas sp.]